MECTIPEFCSVVERKARKTYKCCECGSPIRVGELHVVCTGKWDGALSTYRQHTHCAEACRYIRDELNDDEGCIGFGTLLDWYGEIFHRRDLPKEFRSLMAKVKSGYRKS